MAYSQSPPGTSCGKSSPCHQTSLFMRTSTSYTIHVHHTCTIHVLCMYRTCMVHVWYMYGTCMVHVQTAMFVLFSEARDNADNDHLTRPLQFAECVPPIHVTHYHHQDWAAGKLISKTYHMIVYTCIHMTVHVHVHVYTHDSTCTHMYTMLAAIHVQVQYCTCY